jgi:RNA polymerase sigma-70 factor (ECF subfamily)
MKGYSSIPSAELIGACAEPENECAWEEFVSRFERPITVSVIRAALQWGDHVPRQLLEDLVQETYLKLCSDKCRLLRAFALQYPDSVLGYIKTIAVNVVHDHFKAQNSQKRGAGRVQESVEGVDPQAYNGSIGSPAALERQVLLSQIDACLQVCAGGPDGDRDRLIFWLYYRQGLSAAAIASLPSIKLTAKGVESAILRLTRLVREQIVAQRCQSSTEPEEGQKGFRPAESY